MSAFEYAPVTKKIPFRDIEIIPKNLELRTCDKCGNHIVAFGESRKIDEACIDAMMDNPLYRAAK